MDVFLIDGMEIIFRLAVAILTFGKEDLLSLDMEGMLKVYTFLFDFPIPTSLLSLAYALKFVIWARSLESNFFFFFQARASPSRIMLNIP